MRISDRWNTNRLIIRKAVIEDSVELTRINDSWEDKVLVEGEAFRKGYIENCINNGDLPPIENADIANYSILTIQKSDGKIIGYLDLYHGYPDSDTVWIGNFVMDKEMQGKLYGQEVIGELSEECKKAGWKALGLGVYLKNWKGLRFWKNNGFDKIIGIYKDKEYSETTFSLMGLRKEL